MPLWDIDPTVGSKLGSSSMSVGMTLQRLPIDDVAEVVSEHEDTVAVVVVDTRECGWVNVLGLFVIAGVTKTPQLRGAKADIELLFDY